MSEKYCKPGQVWWANLSPTMGKEQYGVRPVYIAHKFSQELLWVFPLTTKHKKGTWFIPFLFEKQQEASSFLILSQSRTIDKKRLIRKMGKANLYQFHLIMKAFFTLMKAKKVRW